MASATFAPAAVSTRPSLVARRSFAGTPGVGFEAVISNTNISSPLQLDAQLYSSIRAPRDLQTSDDVLHIHELLCCAQWPACAASRQSAAQPNRWSPGGESYSQRCITLHCWRVGVMARCRQLLACDLSAQAPFAL